jgi:hypothetical protein
MHQRRMSERGERVQSEVTICRTPRGDFCLRLSAQYFFILALTAFF